MSVLDTEERELRANFFRYIFGEQIGWLVIGSESAVGGDFKQRFFQWPTEENQLLGYINKEKSNKNVWFGINLYSRKERRKTLAVPGNRLWADLDECSPEDVEPKPQIIIESSPGHFQAIWILNKAIDPQIAEDYSRRIYSKYQNNGVDAAWDAARLLRVPFTNNVKVIYHPEKPKVKLLKIVDAPLEVEIFDALSAVPTTESDKIEDSSIPELGDAADIIARNQSKLRERSFQSVWDYQPTSDDDWSKLLWRLIMICFEAGLSKEDVFSVAHVSSVNKYERDKKPIRYLWRDVVKASKQFESFEVLASTTTFEMPELIPGDRYKLGSSFIERYVRWGEEATDACPQYHELSAFILLSSLLAGNLKLETSFGTIRPNLWGMILGDSTLTRKSTAMRMATDIIDFVDRDILLATDGSAEGILTGLSGRPGRTSMFFRDEVVGLFDSIRKKDYLAGIPQLFTQLYDTNPVRRMLRKELISVDNPIFIFFGGGIKDQFFTAVDESFIYSGFLPRFLIVSGVTDRTKLRRLGPPTPELIEKRQQIYSKLHEVYHTYLQEGDVQILGQDAQMPIDTVAYMTDDAYELYGEISDRMIEAAYDSPNSGLALPTFERLSMSLLKMALLAAAVRQEPDDFKIEVNENDIRRAAKYIQQWGNYSIEVVLNVGQTVAMKIIDKAHRYVIDHPGTTRSTMMRAMNLTKRQMIEIEETLEARGHLRILTAGRGRTYEPIT